MHRPFEPGLLTPGQRRQNDTTGRDGRRHANGKGEDQKQEVTDDRQLAHVVGC